MTPGKTALIAAAIAIALTSGWQYRVRQGRLQEATRLRAENDQMRLQASQRREKQILSARAAGVAGAATNSPAQVVNSGRSDTTSVGATTASAVENLRVPGTDYRNEGQATPISAMQTFAWACDRGDAALMKKLLTFDAAARVKAANMFDSLPREERAQWASLDAMAAAVYISDGMSHPYPVAAILQQAKVEQINPDRVILRLPEANGDGSEFQKTPDGWKFAITEAVVDDYIARNKQPAGR